MDWRDEGIVLSVKRHGESAAIAEVFTPAHGRHAGMVRGGASRKMAPILQPGAQMDIFWNARLQDHLGTFTLEPVRSRSATIMGSRMALAGLNTVTALLSFALPDREPHPKLYARTEQLLDLLEREDLWPLAYLHWEMALLEDLGFGLDLSECAVTGATEELRYVSPRTGKAVTAEGAGAYADRLLPLPACLLRQGDGTDAEIATGLSVTGHFLHNHLATDLGNKPLPEARQRFVDLFQRRL